jgi:hypothetical protein
MGVHRDQPCDYLATLTGLSRRICSITALPFSAQSFSSASTNVLVSLSRTLGPSVFLALRVIFSPSVNASLADPTRRERAE